MSLHVNQLVTLGQFQYRVTNVCGGMMQAKNLCRKHNAEPSAPEWKWTRIDGVWCTVVMHDGPAEPVAEYFNA